MEDKFKDHITGLTSPARDAVAITPSDTNDLTNPTRAIFVGVEGSLSVQMV